MGSHKLSYTVAEVAAAADIPVATVRSWFQAGLIGLTEEDQPAPVGGTRRLSQRTAESVAIAAALTRAGVSVPIAWKAGATFAHTAQGNPRRQHPGQLYPGPKATVVLVAGDEVHILAIDAKSNPLALLSKTQNGTATILFANPVIARMAAGLARSE